MGSFDVVVVFCLFADFALSTLIGSRPDDTFFVVSRTVLVCYSAQP